VLGMAVSGLDAYRETLFIVARQHGGAARQ
jgi:hypothetical protein